MALVLALLTVAVILAVRSKRLGLEQYALIFFATVVLSTAFMLLYFRLFV